VPWGTIVSGAAWVTGGQVPQRIDWLKASLVEHWVTRDHSSGGRSSGNSMKIGGVTFSSGSSVGGSSFDDDDEWEHHYVTHGEIALAAHLDIQPGQQLQFPFELPAPSARDFNHNWYVEAKAGIPGAVDKTGRCDFNLVPPAIYVQAAGVLGSVTGLVLKSWSLHHGGVAAELLPEGDLKRVYDGARLEMFLVGSEINGQVIVNPQERGFMDQLKAMAQADREKFPIRFAPGDLTAAQAQFQAIHQRFMK
jgi:hypothetical protein